MRPNSTVCPPPAPQSPLAWPAKRATMAVFPPDYAIQPGMSDFIIYHNPKCGTSRNALQALREGGVEPTVIEYLKNPPDRATLVSLIEATGLSARALVRSKEALFTELDLGRDAVTEEQLIDAMLAHPVLINRPIVVTPKGTRLVRPLEKLAEIFP